LLFIIISFKIFELGLYESYNIFELISVNEILVGIIIIITNNYVFVGKVGN
jgi:hypothetical protein